jgi:hypothetical protein
MPMITADSIVTATGAPREHVHEHWPTIYDALAKYKVASLRSQVGAAATVAIECPPFKPIPEYASGEAYEGREDLGNIHPGDGVRYKGRGFIQLTGRRNYRSYGKLLGVDLESHPEEALYPETAAQVFALYWKWKKVAAACDAADWKHVRRLVNGGLNGWARFYKVVQALGEK